jgi:3-oxoacyl-[acyl-carrier-protein] synthase-3
MGVKAEVAIAFWLAKEDIDFVVLLLKSWLLFSRTRSFGATWFRFENSGSFRCEESMFRIYALSVADQYIKTGMYKNVLVIGSEVHSTIWHHVVGVLNFGDGAGAAVLSREEDLTKGSCHAYIQRDNMPKN